MSSDVTSAIKAYNASLNQVSGPAMEARSAGSDGSFAGLVEEAAGQMVESLKTSEQMTAQAAAGQADMQEVIMAVANGRDDAANGGVAARQGHPGLSRSPAHAGLIGGQPMNEVEAIEMGREAVYTMLKLASPIMALGLVVGLIVALFQALTSIQEMTLTFVPKIVVIFASVMLLLPYMVTTLQGFALVVFDRIAAG